MTREEFLQRAALAGLGMAFMPSFLTSCKKIEEITPNFNGRVIIIGGGAAGMMAAHAFNHFGIDFQLIEAGSVLGGRVKKTDSFADFPIDLGAEWIHAGTDLFAEMLKYGNQTGTIDVLPYNPESIYQADDGELIELEVGTNFYGENKFSKSTWYDFFGDYVIPGIQDKVVLNAPVTNIDHSGTGVSVTTSDGTIYTADKVVVTIPLTILKEEYITFTPALSEDKKAAIDAIPMPDGIKVFVEFSERFYPDLIGMSSLTSDGDGEKLYYDAAFKKESNKNILGLFTVNTPSSEFVNLTNDEIIAKVLGVLDELYDGKATETYVKHVIQNWSKEPFIKGSYSYYGSSYRQEQETIKAPIDNKVYFAGEALSFDNSSTVHGAAETGTEVAEQIIQGN